VVIGFLHLREQIKSMSALERVGAVVLTSLVLVFVGRWAARNGYLPDVGPILLAGIAALILLFAAARPDSFNF
jgi:hypothetical protein